MPRKQCFLQPIGKSFFQEVRWHISSESVSHTWTSDILGWILINSSDSRVMPLQIYLDKTTLSMWISALIVYPVHTMLLKLSREYETGLVYSKHGFFEFLSVETVMNGVVSIADTERSRNSVYWYSKFCMPGAAHSNYSISARVQREMIICILQKFTDKFTTTITKSPGQKLVLEQDTL